MSLDVQQLLNKSFPIIEHTYDHKDTIRYALSLGLGMDPLDERQLRFVHEEHAAGFLVQPSMASVLAYAGHWSRDPELGLDWKRIVHGEQYVTLHRPVPPAATVVAQTRITKVVDKGKDKGAILYAEREIRDKLSRERIATVVMATFARGDGGRGGSSTEVAAVHGIPRRDPDIVADFQTSPQAGLLYRLAGDYNPLHAAPSIAAEAGYRAPILHGLCTLGVACHRIVERMCDGDPARMRSLSCRFTAPVYPGEMIRTEIWRDGESVSFRAAIPARGTVVLDHGRSDIS